MMPDFCVSKASPMDNVGTYWNMNLMDFWAWDIFAMLLNLFPPTTTYYLTILYSSSL